MMYARFGLFLLAAGVSFPALAQSTGPDLDVAIEVATDLRERGLSMSRGRAGGTAIAGLGIDGLRIDARASSLRGSARHGGADVGIEAGGSYRIDSGGWSIEGGGVIKLFPDVAGDWDYVETFASAAYLLGPVELRATTFYAPDQRAIGGDNLYLRAGARAFVPGTPWTLAGHIGRSSGSRDEPLRAERLRPGGSYTDWSLGVEWTRASITAGLRYSDTSVDRGRVLSPVGDPAHNGARLTGTLAFTF